MTRLGFADADNPSWRTRLNRRLADLAFLARLRAASHEELIRELRTETSRWRRAAIATAIARLEREKERASR